MNSVIAPGILREAENPSVAALQRRGVVLPMLRHDLQEALPPRWHPRFGEIVLPTTPGEQEVVNLAATEAASLKDEYVGNEHLLPAILRDSNTRVAQMFLRHSFTYETAASELQSLKGRK